MRIAGIALLIAGIAAIGYVVNAYWISASRTTDAQERLAAELEAEQAAAIDLIENPTVGADWDEAEAASVTAGEPLTYDPTSTSVVDTTEEYPLITQPAPEEGTALGRMLIPDISLDWVIVEGVRPEDLAQGPGHMTWTALPGQPGNTVISGHRTTYGAPFYAIDELESGSRITIEMVTGVHIYEVVDIIVVTPDGVWVTQQTDGAWLTLTTCHPRGRAQERLIVFARLVAGPNFEAINAMFDDPWQLPEQPSTEDA
jgi:LPXTG-site transpeptidase (sortase) family protein